MFGSLSKLQTNHQHAKLNLTFAMLGMDLPRSHAVAKDTNAPLNTRQDRGDIVCRTPPILQNVQAQLPRRIHIRMKHLRYELDSWRFVRIRFFELHYQSERAVFKGSVGGSHYNSIPAENLMISFYLQLWRMVLKMTVMRDHEMGSGGDW